MKFNFTNSYRFTPYMKVFLALLFVGLGANTHAQIVPTTGYTATQLVNKLVGPGVTTSGAVLTCDGDASGEFRVTSSNLGIDCGVVLTTGAVVTSGSTIGVNILTGTADNTFGNFASTAYLGAGDADLTALAGQPTFDACILEFDFIPSGDTIRFNYVFGSEEYPNYTCDIFNDVFGFLISGPGFATPTNIALVPGTNVPVCINSVNGGVPTGAGVMSNCTGVGPGSPFPAYFVNNTTGTTVSYDGFTTVLTAKAAVTPCASYHLKLGIADAVDWSFDSGVFLEAGSLSSIPQTTLTAVGIGTIPYAIRGCAPGHITFTTAASSCTPTIIKYNISGTAINGYDYATIPDSVIIPPFGTTATVNITPTLLPPAGPRTVILTVLTPDHCDPDLLVPNPLETATLTIYDSFHLHIITPDTSICRGEHVNIQVQADTVFGIYMSYNWTPTTGLSSPTVLNPIATPTATTTYHIAGNVTLVAGCPDATDDITITVYEPPVITVDSHYVKTCVGIPVQLHVYTPVGSTVPYDYAWTPPTYLNSTSISNPVTTPLAAGDVIYTVTVNPTAQPQCKSTDTIRVHTISDFTLNTVNTILCLGQAINVSITGGNAGEVNYSWTPTAGVVTATSQNPIITPPAPGDYTYVVHGAYARCPDYIHSFNVHVDAPVPAVIVRDTICLGMSYTSSTDFTASGGSYYHYQWVSVPGTMVISNDTIPNPTFTPSAPSQYTLTVTIQPLAAACAIQDIIYLNVLPNVITVRPVDTSICLGQVVQILGNGDPNFSYQWIPTAGIAVSNVLNAFVMPDTTALYTVTAHFHSCPDIYATSFIHVQPTPTVYLGGNRPMCEFDSVHIHGSVSPAWYSGYTYAWSPAADLDNTTTSNVVFTGHATTNIHLVVTSSAGCTGQDSALITVHAGNFATPLADLYFCPHDSAILNPTGSLGNSYYWFPSYYLSDTFANSPIIKPITSQTYHAVVTDINGCKDTVSFSAIVYPGALISLPDDSVTLHPGEDYTMNPWSNCSSFSWFPYTGLSNPFVANPVAAPDVSTMYIVTGITENGCKAQDSISVNVDPSTVLALPNAFTPGTGANSEFKIIKQGIANLNYFRIFNRWGNMVFETTKISEGWDGSWKGEPQPFGVYVYSIQAVTSEGKIFNKSGNVTVIR